jgi:hypothetical protein
MSDALRKLHPAVLPLLAGLNGGLVAALAASLASFFLGADALLSYV